MSNDSLPARIDGWLDVALGGGGLIGLLLFILVGPRIHPHSVAADHISHQQAVDTARAFTQRISGLPLGNARAEATIHYDAELLNALQERFGREEAMHLLREEVTPGYRWQVVWTEDGENGNVSLGSTEVGLDGHPIGVNIASSSIPRDTYHEGALMQLFGPAIPVDSLFTGRPTFRLDTPRGNLPATAGNSLDTPFLDRSDAEKLALFHLGDTRLGRREVRVDSIFASGSDGVVTATVRVSTNDTTPGRYFGADIEVMPTGTLVHLSPRFVPGAEPEQMSLDADGYRELGVGFLYALIAVVLIVVFFRRLNSRLVDINAALRDGLMCGVAGAVAVSAQIFGFDTTEPMELVGFLIGMAIVGGAVGIGMFFVSGAANSLVGDRWDDKLQTFKLMRQLYVRNVPVGLALLRGVAGGLTLVGIGVAIPALFGNVAIRLSDDSTAFYTSSVPGMDFLGSGAESVFVSYFLTFACVLGIGALLHRKVRSVPLVIGGIALTLGALQISPLDFRPLPVEIFVSALFGALLALAFWRFGALETLTALFVLLLLLRGMPNLSVGSAPEFIDGMLGLGAIGVLAFVGFVGVVSRKTSSEVPEIVPEYIRDLAQQERLKRELELAREVQLSLLPTRMPEIRGLDIATICLPANEVGGDYYDFFRMDHKRLGIVVGDVSGKGIQAAFYMTLMKGILQSLNSRRTRPSEILSCANDLFRVNAPKGVFMSIIFGVLDVENHTWTCARAGHNPALIQRTGTIGPEEIKSHGAAIGLISNSAFAGSIEEVTTSVEEGDLLLIYTDGVTEAMNRKRQLFDESRLKESMTRAKGEPAAAVIASIIAEVETFCGDAPRHDDMTMVAVRILGNDEG